MSTSREVAADSFTRLAGSPISASERSTASALRGAGRQRHLAGAALGRGDRHQLEAGIGPPVERRRDGAVELLLIGGIRPVEMDGDERRAAQRRLARRGDGGGNGRGGGN